VQQGVTDLNKGMVSQLPTGTVTFLFTDIEGSTEIAQAHPEAWESLRARHDEFLRSAVDAHRGFVFGRVGDACCAAFSSAEDALSAALDAQRLLQYAPWAPATIRVRMGLHTGEAQVVRDSQEHVDYVGYATLARVARIMEAAHGEQVLLSPISAGLARDALRDRCTLKDLGPQRLKGFEEAEHLWQATALGLRATFPPARSPAATPNNLPTSTTRFIGRVREIAECGRLLEQGRLVTLTAIGGAGKTRLAIEAARVSIDKYPGGVWFVDLAQVQDGDRVAQAIAAAVGLREKPGMPLVDTVAGYFQMRHALLLLDNCEHLLDAVSALVESLLERCQQLSILATSREGLRVAGEQMFTVRSLAMPDSADPERAQQSDAVALFLDRASLADPALRIDLSTMPRVIEICERLDGIALAIELAAARVKVLTVDDICARLGDRFRLLTGGNRALPRQQTLLATLKWSYDLLMPDERNVLQRLAVFVGGWTLAAATGIAGDDDNDEFAMLEMLTRLADKSLIALDRRTGAESRYTMLETVRQYALEQIDGDMLADVRVRHARFFVEFAGKWLRILREEPSRTSALLSKIDADHDNVLAAHAECGSFDDLAQPGLELVSAVATYWEHKGMLALAWQLLGEALARKIPPHAGAARCRALASVLRIGLLSGRYDEAERAGQTAMDLARALGDEHSLGTTLNGYISIANARGDLGATRVRVDEYLALSSKLGGRHPYRARHLDAELRRRQGDLAGAEELYLRNLDEARSSANMQIVAHCKINLGFVAAQRSDASALRQHLLEYMEIRSMTLNLSGSTEVVLELCAALANLVSSPDLSARFHAVAQALGVRTGYRLEPLDLIAVTPHIESARAQLGETRFDALAAAASGERADATIDAAQDWLKTLPD
jgi:predicted ATPase/class 3 adenylate cyclase